MGCESSRATKNCVTVVKKTTKEELRRHGQLTEFEKDVIHSTWPLLSSQMCEHGCAVLFSAIQMSPGLKAYFTYGDLTEQNIFMHPEFRKHGLDYMRALADVVDHIDNLGGNLSDRLIVLGAKHASIPNFKLDYLKIFVRATLNTWEGVLGEEYTEEVRYVWTILLDFIVKLMTEGCLIYDEEGSCSQSSNVSLHSSDLGALYPLDGGRAPSLGTMPSQDQQQQKKQGTSQSTEQYSHFSEQFFDTHDSQEFANERQRNMSVRSTIRRISQDDDRKFKKFLKD